MESTQSCCAPVRPDEETKPCCAALSEKRAPADFELGLKPLPGGEFSMGEDRPKVARPEDGEGPIRRVTVEPFAIGIAPVTIAQWARFVESTNYISEAERFGWSYVFHKHLTAKARENARGVAGGAQWWVGVEGASWKHPEGPGSHTRKREDHPVTHVSWNDALAFCQWGRCAFAQRNRVGRRGARRFGAQDFPLGRRFGAPQKGQTRPSHERVAGQISRPRHRRRRL